jgi:hypothetical protein
MSQESVTEIKEDLAVHRQELGATVDALAAKLDVKTHAKAKAVELAPWAAGVGALLAVVLVWRHRR